MSFHWANKQDWGNHERRNMSVTTEWSWCDIRLSYFFKTKPFIYDFTFKVIQWMVVSDLSNFKVYYFKYFVEKMSPSWITHAMYFRYLYTKDFCLVSLTFWMILCSQLFSSLQEFNLAVKLAVQREGLSFYICPYNTPDDEPFFQVIWELFAEYITNFLEEISNFNLEGIHHQLHKFGTKL